MSDQEQVYDYILAEENRFKIDRVPVSDGWDWNFFEHVKRCTLLKNSRYEGKNLGDQPYKNIIRPILNVAYRSEGFDVKDIEPFVNNPKFFYKSFLTRRYHSPFARKHNIDEYIDDLVESYADYGGAISKNVNMTAPEVVPLQRITFCDQTNMKSGPLCEKHSYSEGELQEMVELAGWDADAVEMAITMAAAEKSNSQADGQKAKTPGKYIEVYELHGTFKASWLGSNWEGAKARKKQMHIVTFYVDKTTGKKKGVTLYCGPEKESPYKFLVRDKIYNRALGFSAIEELFEAQIWTNYNAIQIKEMLDIAAHIVIKTTDQGFAERNPKITDLEKGQIVYNAEGTDVVQLGITPVNMNMFDRSTEEWKQIARTTGSAQESILGERPSAGTPFKLQEFVTNENYGLHEWRQGKIAVHVAEVYRDWVLPRLVKEMNEGKEFMDKLSLDELNEVADAIVTNEVNGIIKKRILNNGIVTPQEQEMLMQEEKDKFMKGGSKRFLKVFKDELKTLPVDVEINIKGKQKDLAKITAVLTNIFRQLIQNPQILENPAFAKLFNQIIEASGLSPIDFAAFVPKKSPYMQPDQANAGNGTGQDVPANDMAGVTA